MLKNIIFDCGGVIFHWDPDTILLKYFPVEAVPLVKPVIFRAWEKLDNGSAAYADYAEESCRLVPEIWRAQTKAFFDRVYFEMDPIEDTWALIGRLKARKYRVFLLSNAPTTLSEHAWEICPLMRAFDGIVVSATINLVKPDRAIYEYALKTWQIDPAESLFVDDVAQNVQGAKACGLHGYQYREDAEALLKAIEALS